MLAKVHRLLCIGLWVAWAVGLLLTFVSSLSPVGEAAAFFHSVVHPYNAVVSILSLIPLQPAIGFIRLHQEKRNGSPCKARVATALLLVSTVLAWLLYTVAYVELVGGV